MTWGSGALWERFGFHACSRFLRRGDTERSRGRNRIDFCFRVQTVSPPRPPGWPAVWLALSVLVLGCLAALPRRLGSALCAGQQILTVSGARCHLDDAAGGLTRCQIPSV
ncbi:hypothetical protein COCON_G00059400 [Conger conger]|uniref:Uncharacterized protein n=1 Tax=Conger conger TaxID=82655 RepID=A0A9Q1DR80_CONCO|nr:hypothetical protein COCON_G00059400 [Conger conger]